MRHITAKILFALVVQGCTKEPTANHNRHINECTNMLANKLADDLVSRLQDSGDKPVNNLFERSLKTALPHRRLDKTALAKPGEIGIPPYLGPHAIPPGSTFSDTNRMDVLTKSCPYDHQLLIQSSQSAPARQLGIMDYFYNWFKDILVYLGMSHKSGKILFLGLDNAGKSTLFHLLKTGRVVQCAPTQHSSSDELVVGSVKFRTFDLGGHDTARQIWKQYFTAVDGIIFLIDSADRSRFPEVAEELRNLISDPDLAKVPFAILGNKIDIPGSASQDELRISLGLHAYATYKRDLEVFMCSVAKRSGYPEAFRWISQFLK